MRLLIIAQIREADVRFAVMNLKQIIDRLDKISVLATLYAASSVFFYNN